LGLHGSRILSFNNVGERKEIEVIRVVVGVGVRENEEVNGALIPFEGGDGDWPNRTLSLITIVCPRCSLM